MSHPDRKHVLFDFFDGRATTIQRKEIESWVTDPANEPLYYQYLNDWESQHPQYFPDTEGELTKFRHLLGQPFAQIEEPRPIEAITRPILRPNRAKWLGWQVAAALLLVMGAGLFLARNPLFYKTYQTQNAQTQTFRLSDNTVVSLNANSSLLVPRWGFPGKNREVILTGDAEFEVSHTVDHKRFVVRTPTDFAVVVLGTEFVVSTRSRGNRVILKKGKVQVAYEAGKQITMRPGDVLTMSQANRQVQIAHTNKPQVFSAWKTHDFYYDKVPLSEVANDLYDHFGLRVQFADSTVANRRLSGSFKAKTNEEVINVLSALLGLNLNLQENTLLIPATQ